MTRHLVLVRHAKSAWDQPASGDHERTLSDRGRNALPLMNAYLAESPVQPDVVWCSSAQRTIETLAGLRSALREQVAVDTDRNLYHANETAVIAHLREVADDVQCVMVVGHNPTMQSVALLLAGGGGGDAEALRQVEAKVPTGAIMTISFDGRWGDLAAGVGRLDALFTPRPPRR